MTGDEGSLNRYLNKLFNSQVFKAEQEIKLAKIIQAWNEKALTYWSKPTLNS